MRFFGFAVFCFLLFSCATGPHEPPVYGTNQPTQTELASIREELTQVDSLTREAEARLRQSRREKGRAAEEKKIAAQAEITELRARRASLLHRRQEIETESARRH